MAETWLCLINKYNSDKDDNNATAIMLMSWLHDYEHHFLHAADKITFCVVGFQN